MSGNSLSITDNRTGKQYELPIENGTIKAIDLRQIKTAEDDFGLMTYDPAFMNTASCKSKITFIDGDKGILEYRGYPIDQLAEKSSYLEVAYLLLNGELPTADELKAWTITSLITPLSTKASRRLSTAFTTTPIRWECLKPRSARFRRSTLTRRTFSTWIAARNRFTG